MHRAVIHLNIADFAAAVEQMANTHLKNRPVIIAPQSAHRAVVYDMSDDAFQAGVRKGMALQRAQRLCKEACVRPPRLERYEQVMRTVAEFTRPFSPLVECGAADGHVFLDITGTRRLLGPPVDVAWRLHRRVQRELGFDPIWSVAPNKLLAKVATRLAKPRGEYIVAAGEETRVLAPLPLHVIPGIERDELARLAEFGLTEVSQMTALNLGQLRVLAGNRADFVYTAVRGIDASPVRPAGQRAPAVSVGHAFDEDTNDAAEVEGVLYGLVEKAGKDLRQQLLATADLALLIDYSDGLRSSRRKKACPPTANDMRLFELARQVLYLAWWRRVRIRHIRLICERLVFPPAQQLDLFAPRDVQEQRRTRLVAALDAVRQRFGDRALRIGRTLAWQ